jgi:hypothetical protein
MSIFEFAVAMAAIWFIWSTASFWQFDEKRLARVGSFVHEGLRKTYESKVVRLLLLLDGSLHFIDRLHVSVSWQACSGPFDRLLSPIDRFLVDYRREERCPSGGVPKGKEKAVMRESSETYRTF